MYLKSLLSLSVLAASTVSHPLVARAVVDHDSLSPLPETIQQGAIGSAIGNFNPLLHIAHGCQPYPAVNAAGDTSGGLQDTGSSTGGCRDTNKGQTYTRAALHGGKLAIMYAWYFPKDMPSSGITVGAHRHDWESIVVWVTDPSLSTPQILGAAASGHGEYKTTTNPQRQGNQVQVEYFTSFPTNHELQFTTTVGRTYPILDWDVMTPAARSALQNTDFGSANVPFKDGNFLSNLDKALV